MKKQTKITLLLLILLVACTPGKKLALLSFFFDGVPKEDTNTEQLAADSLFREEPLSDSILALAPAAPPLYYHKPYLEKNCTACHDKNAVGNLLKPEPELCYGCHENFSTKFKTLHGPVDAGFCSACHLPHMSQNKGLLSAPGNEHCFPCHITYEVKQPPDHVEIGDKRCIKCHDPHGIKDWIPRS